MKPQYLVGQPTKKYIRVSDGVYLMGCSLDLDEARTAKKNLKRSKIYKLVEVKK